MPRHVPLAASAWLVVPLLLLADLGCLRAPDSPAAASDAPVLGDSPFEHDWLPGTGRGTLSVVTPAGERVEILLHEDSLAFTGGLLPGGPGAVACRRWPAGASEPIPVWGAWDESIVDHDQGLEYTYGWSRNVGRAADGVALRWLGGRVVEQGSDGLTIAGVNGEYPYSVARWLRVLPDGTMLHRVRITNVGSATAHFDLWTGDDPPLAGQAAWADGRQLAHETTLDAYALSCVGVGGSAMCIAPTSPPPTRAYVAAGFAHGDEDTDPHRRLDGPIAFNVGWTDLRLPVGQSFEVQYALAEVDAAAAGTPPTPVIAGEHWARLAALDDLHPDVIASVHDRLELATAVVALEILPGGGEIEVRANYTLRNSGNDHVTRPLHVPFATGDDLPQPHEVEISIGPHELVADGASFTVAVPAREERAVVVRYRQRLPGREATFVATGLRSWSHPLAELELQVITPAGIEPLDISYDMEEPVEAEGKATYSTKLLRFLPDRDLTVRW
jgi:hypothetical protein